MIEHICEKGDVKCDFMRYLICKRGRLCDKFLGEKVMAIAIQGDVPPKWSSWIILKCPKCSQKFIISLFGEIHGGLTDSFAGSYDCVHVSNTLENGIYRIDANGGKTLVCSF